MRVLNPAETAPAVAGAMPFAIESASRRHRLWELEPAAQAAVVGLCLQPAALRRVAAEAADAAPDDDRELHWAVLAECAARTAVAEALQRELDRRHQLALRRAGLAAGEAALATWWRDASVRGDLAGALWAAVTHPDVTPELVRRVLAELHALQQRTRSAIASASASASAHGQSRLDALIRENQILARELGAAQQRSARLAVDHTQAADAAASALVRTRAEVLRRDIELAQLRERLAGLEGAVAAVPSPRSRVTRQQQREQADRIAELQRALAQTQLQCEQQRLRNAELADELGAVRRTVTVAPAVRAGLASAALRDRSVLCVSARTASVPVYRQLVERTGGRFVHHDDDDAADGRELDARLDAADLVICQTGCLSHDAYWRVKTHCKRTGKRCVFVETPSRRALERALGEVSAAPQVSDEIAAVAASAAAPGGAAGAIPVR